MNDHTLRLRAFDKTLARLAAYAGFEISADRNPASALFARESSKHV